VEQFVADLDNLGRDFLGRYLVFTTSGWQACRRWLCSDSCSRPRIPVICAAAYLALGVAAEVSMQPQVVRSAWIGMELSGWFVIVHLACLAFLTGLVLSFRTPWGLVKHYWVVIALVLTTLSLAVLLLHMPSVSTLAGLAQTADDAAASQLGGDVLHPALGLPVLIAVTVLNVHKPRGLTRTGNTSKPRKRRAHQNRAERSTPRPAEVVLLGQNERSQVPAENEKGAASVLGPVCAAASAPGAAISS
jgi:hypothetical protein